VPLLEIKQPECEADKSLPLSDEVNDDWCQSAVSYMPWCVGTAVPVSYDGVVQCTNSAWGKLALRLSSIS
jgi:hypothetical protein